MSAAGASPDGSSPEPPRESPTGGARHALYFVPGDATPLARFGQGVLGRDALGRAVERPADLPAAPDDWTRRPARYGFHATLKAPFHLAPDASEMALVEACDALAGTHAPVPLPGLAPRRLGDFVALVLPAQPVPLERLAADCVIGLEPFRAPLDAAALARRRPESLDPAARARLERWGYPHVLDGFRFHMTLSGALLRSASADEPGEPGRPGNGGSGNGRGGERGADRDGRSVERWLEALRTRFAERVGDGATLDRLALCREETRSSPFVRIAEFALRGG